jgi:hypothetical protein
MKRWIPPFAVGMAVLYAILAIGATSCLVLHAEQPLAHHHSDSHLPHSALCAWACQINPTVILPAAVPLLASLTVTARRRQSNSKSQTASPASECSSRAPPLSSRLSPLT